MPDPASRSASGRSSFRYSTPVATSERLAAHLRPVGQPDDLVRVLHGHAHDLLRGQDLGPEAAGLGHGPTRQVGAGQAGREAQVVVDPRRRAGLASRGLALHHQGLEPLGGAVDGGGQARRPATDDDQVVVGQRGVRPQADPRGDLGVGRRRRGASRRRTRPAAGRRRPRRRWRRARMPPPPSRRRASGRGSGYGPGSP